MKLEVGMYVRTTDGLLALLTELYNENSVIVKWQYDEKRRRESFSQSISKDYIKKASHNIIDLIEEGDYVNGQKVTSVSLYRDEDGTSYWIADEYVYDDKYHSIKEILTKEQYESMVYKTGD